MSMVDEQKYITKCIKGNLRILTQSELVDLSMVLLMCASIV